MTAAYPGAIEYPAHPTNIISGVNSPKVVVLHTPEEPADDYPGTAYYFAQPNRSASTTWFVSYLAFVFECVHPSKCAIANGVTPGMPYPAGTDPNISLNRQSLSIEVEGYTATIQQTITPAQFKALVDLVRWACDTYGIPKDRAHIIGHREVASNRSDPGPWLADAVVAALEEDMGYAEDIAAIKAELAKQAAVNTAQNATDEAIKKVLAEHDGRLDVIEAQAPATHTHETGPPK